MPNKKNKEPKSGLDFAISAINKQFGENSIMRLGENAKMDVSVRQTGSIAIDTALGVGGLPKGRIVEIFGPESSGKTTFCLSVIAEAQKDNAVCAFIDVEHALDPKYAKRLGVKLPNLHIAQPESGEDALNMMETLVRCGEVDVIILDSVAGLVSKTELNGQIGDATVGIQARMMSQAMRRLAPAVNETKCLCIFTNQIREKIGVMFGSPETTPGGRALKFFSSVRMDIRRIGQIKDTSGKVTGNRTRLKVVKNKVAPPFTECEFDIMYAEGISEEGSILDIGVELGAVDKKGAWFSYNEKMIGQGRDAAKTYLKNNPEIKAQIKDRIKTISNVEVGKTIGKQK